MQTSTIHHISERPQQPQQQQQTQAASSMASQSNFVSISQQLQHQQPQQQSGVGATINIVTANSAAQVGSVSAGINVTNNLFEINKL